MFKFMKSKKGFTLVELMIVVVIMAILVAVAVPIYSAVTKNARAKTCASNRREIVSQISNYCMGGSDDGSMFNGDDSFVITTNAAGDGADVSTEGTTFDKDVVTGMFQELPYCPVKNGTIEVTLAKNANGATSIVTVECTTTEEPHGV